MTDIGAGPASPNYPQGSTVTFLVLDSFPETNGVHGLLQAENGDVFFVQPIAISPDRPGGHIVTITAPNTYVTLTVERSFASGYLILGGTATGQGYFATPLAPGTP